MLKIRILCGSFFLAGCFFLLTTCGLDEYYVIDSPVSVLNLPLDDFTDHAQMFFSFYTNERGMKDYISSLNPSASYVFMGTDVYYKIYNNASTLKSEREAINNIVASENYFNAAERMMDNYKYVSLKTDSSTKIPLIPATGEDRKVHIRLTDYYSDEMYSARILVDDMPLYGVTTVPTRNNGDTKYTFNFGRTGINDRIPDKDDPDVKYSTNFTADDTWYVNMYAVAMGRDSALNYGYSNLLWLGTVPINASLENN